MASTTPMSEKQPQVVTTEAQVVTTEERARQGGLGRQVLLVLVGGLILAMVAWAIAGFYGMAIAPDTIDTQTTAPTTQSDAAKPAP